MRDLFPNEGSQPRIVSQYDHKYEHDQLVYQVVRYEPKAFRQRRPDGKGGWVWNVKGVQPVLYRLPEVLAASDILVCEGERDCETARALGLVATCNPGGASKWRPEFSEALRGKRVTVIADADEPGRKHAGHVEASLTRKVESLKVVELPNAKDLTEWVASGGTREKLLDRLRDAPERKLAEVVCVDNLALLLEETVKFIRRFIALTPAQADVIALWVAHTHAFGAADTTPYLAITSAEKQSGKTRLLEVLDLVVAKPWFTSRVSPAVLARKVANEQPTLLLDESDAAFKSGE
jgi:DNA primase